MVMIAGNEASLWHINVSYYYSFWLGSKKCFQETYITQPEVLLEAGIYHWIATAVGNTGVSFQFYQ